MKVFKKDNLIIKSWCENPEQGALDQAFNTASAPYIFRQVCLMPDTHQGYGVPIGGVVATKGVILPEAVGVDIGCGMIAVETSIDVPSVDQIKAVMGKIRAVIPVGMNHRADKCPISAMPSIGDIISNGIVEREFESARKQLGTLGSGNHFLELQKDAKGKLWVMIHSGSRNIGYKVAEHYIDEAKLLNKMWYTNTPEEICMLPADSELGIAYAAEMQYCVDFALANRKMMLDDVMAIISHDLGASFKEPINIAHNYAAIEHHYGENVIVHRKGATRARLGELGIIPGSQGTKSYIVEGLGNPESFQSCSHGAGRTMGRKEATRVLDLVAEIKILDDQGIVHGIRTAKDLEEATSAYKDIDIVMEEQKDLVKIVTELLPVAVIKG